MKFIFYSFLAGIILATNLTYSQTKSKNIKIKWAEQTKSKSRFADVSRFFRIKDDYFAYKIERKGLFSPIVPFLEKYDSDLNYLNNSVLPKKGFPDGRLYEGILDVDDKVYIFSSKLDKATNSKTIFFQTLNPESNKLNNDITKITSIKADKKAKRISYDIYRSEDEKKMLVIVHYPFFTMKETREAFGMFVFDGDMKKVWEIEKYEMKYTDKEFSIDQFIVSTEGNVYMMGSKWVKRSEAKKTTKKGKAHDAFELTTFTENGKTIRSFPISFEGHFINDFDMTVNKEGNLAGAGFYSKSNAGFGDGAFIFAINPEDGELVAFKNKEFSVEFLKEGKKLAYQKKIDKKSKKGKDLELPNLEVREIVPCEDGSYRLIGEQYRFYTTTHFDSNGNVRTTNHYVYGDIVVVHIDADQEITWISKIPKYQHSTNDGGFFSSYALCEYKGKMVFIFNDHIDNLIAFKEKKGYKNYTLKKKKGAVVGASVSRDGKTERELIYSLEEDQAYLRPKAGMQITDNELVVFARLKKKGYKIGRITLK